MRRILLLVLGVAILAAAVAVLALGAFPPRPVTHTVEKSVPASAFTSH